MKRIVVKSKVGSDGVSHLELPLGVEEWRAWVESMAGSIADPNFERPPQSKVDARSGEDRESM